MGARSLGVVAAWLGALGSAACGGATGAAGDAAVGTGDAAADATPGPDGAPPLDAPLETWTWVPVAGMTCADGSATGVGVNLSERSDRVMIYLQGGGACWDQATCFQVMSATHIVGGYGATEFETEIGQVGQSYIFQRTAANPFADATWIYVPYCTGDLHAGDAVATYGAAAVHHAGRANARAAIARLAATRPAADLVWFVGVSAGGYGVALDADLVRAAWPTATVRVLADSAPLVTMETTRWATMVAAWHLTFPAGCATCATDLGAMTGALRGVLGPGDRYGLLASTRDATIATYTALGPTALASATTALQATLRPSAGQAAWVIDGTGHVVLASPAQVAGGISAADWVARWASGDAAWANAGP